VVERDIGLRESKRKSNGPRFPQFLSQIFRDYAENCIDSDEATTDGFLP
jgi:hypothetical protein